MARKKKRGVIAWLLDHGIGAAYTVILFLTVALVKLILVSVLVFIAWWEKIR